MIIHTTQAIQYPKNIPRLSQFCPITTTFIPIADATNISGVNKVVMMLNLFMRTPWFLLTL